MTSRGKRFAWFQVSAVFWVWMCTTIAVACLWGVLGRPGLAWAGPAARNLALEKIPGATPRNVVFILSDDHRWDAMSYVGHPFVQTPRLDGLAKGGVHFANAFVTTSLCSPSRASILTGLYARNHGVTGNHISLPARNTVFPQYLQQAGYETAFIGKWHMGHRSDAPQPGFDHWVSFRGQGHYFPAKGRTLDVNGQRVPQKGYMTDELTDYAVEWLEDRTGEKPFFLYLSHKGVHGLYDPAPRHRDRYKDVRLVLPETMADTPENYRGKPKWVKQQRNTVTGVDNAYLGRGGTVPEMVKHYCEMILSIDQSVGRIMDQLEKKGLAERTLVIYMGDNGHLWGEHGLIDKRCAYEESIRVPLIAHCPAIFKPGTVVDALVANIDIAPTIMESAGLGAPESMDGASFLKLAAGRMESKQWRQHILYEYYRNKSYVTPTTFAVRDSRYKLIRYAGVSETDELYDLENDPRETTNLITDPRHGKIAEQLGPMLKRWIEQSRWPLSKVD